MASADSWKGPFRQTDIKPIDRSQKNIDPFLFRDDDGKHYLYHVRFGNGNFIWVAEFNLAKGEIHSRHPEEVHGEHRRMGSNTPPTSPPP